MLQYQQAILTVMSALSFPYLIFLAKQPQQQSTSLDQHLQSRLSVAEVVDSQFK